MASCMMYLLLQLLLFSCIYFSFVGADYVPVVMLTAPSGNLPSRSVSAVHKISAKEFQDDYLHKLRGQGPLIVFLQDTLSLEDFGQYGSIYGAQPEKSAFKNLEGLLDRYPSLYIPAVETSEGGLAAHLKDWEIGELAADSVDKINSTGLSENALLLVKLPGTATSSNRREAIRKNDEIVGEALNHLRDLEKFSVVFSGQRPSWTTDQEDHLRVARHILEATEDTNALVFHNNYTIFYALNVTYSVTTNTTKLDDLIKDLKYDAFMANDSIRFWMAGSVGSTTVNASFTFKRSSSSWYLESLETQAGDTAASLKSGEIWAPAGMSFACRNLGKLYNRDKTVALTFDQLQIQPMFDSSVGKNEKFGDAFDCVGFFTIAIWMSIFITIILVLILAYGIVMLMNINTNDRFDDPKGKSISVPVVD